MLLAGIISHSEETAGLIRRFLGEMTRSRGLSLSCVSYDNSYAFLGDWRRGEERFDLLFWDLSFLPEGAMQTAADVRAKWADTEMVFLAEDDSRALEAFRLGARHYLLLPAAETEVREAVDRCLSALEGSWRRKVLLKTAAGWRSVALADIEAVISEDHVQRMYLSGGEELCLSSTLSSLTEKLRGRSAFHFLSPGRGILVNAERVKEIGQDTLTLEGGRELPLVKRKAGAFRKEWEKALCRSGE